ncbi:MAG: hypothetical protein ACI8P3_002176 [Saprospiraceae bacterium]|jgi:hypothetical protein
MKQTITLLLLLITTFLPAQSTADFENFSIDANTFLNGSEGSDGYASGNIFLPNSYNDIWQSWSGWAISNVTDNSTPGFLNQYSAITGEGFNGSSNYAVTFVDGASVIQLENMAVGEVVNGLYVTNGTYPFFSMQDGDGFAKRFGGVNGNDPDFFLLTIKKYLNGALSTDSVDFYLADYRFSDNTQDYLIDDWNYIDLSSLGTADSLQFTLSSSDTGQFGMNTPGYFCVDNIVTSDGTTAVNTVDSPKLFEVYPNPAADFMIIKNREGRDGSCVIYDVLGNAVYVGRIDSDWKEIDISGLVSGTYLVEVWNGGSSDRQILIKQ